MSKWIEFNIHNSAFIRVAKDAPTAPLLKDMFEPFLTEGLDHHDLTISGDLQPIDSAAHADTDFQYTATSLYINATKVQILLNEKGFTLNGRRELLVSALPLIDRILVTRGVAMVHAAAVDYRGQGICLPAWGGTGKTSMIAKLLKLEAVSFMGDDWAFLSKDGRLLGYAKPMFIKPHHRPIYPHLFHTRRKPLVPSMLSRRLATIATLVHPLMTQYPRLAHFLRRWSPEYIEVTPRQAFPDAAFSTSAPLAATVFVERYDGSRPVLQEMEKPWMVSRLIGNFHSEIKSHSQEVVTALGACALVPIEQTFREKAAVLERALDGKPVFLLQVPRLLSADHASDTMVENLQKVFARSGIR